MGVCSYLLWTSPLVDRRATCCNLGRVACRWVTVAGLELGAAQGVRGPATGGQGEATERWVDRPLKPAAQANASALLKQGWSMQPLSDELREQMMSNGALVRYWVRGDRTLQELVHEREGRTQLKMTTLPRQSELQP